MLYLARLVVCITAATVFVALRRVLVWLLRSLPADHPFRVAQTSVYEHLTDDLIRRSWRPIRPNGGGKARRELRPTFNLRMQIAAMLAVKVLPLALLFPGALLAAS